jgi:hypothetical protein
MPIAAGVLACLDAQNGLMLSSLFEFFTGGILLIWRKEPIFKRPNKALRQSGEAVPWLGKAYKVGAAFSGHAELCLLAETQMI